MKKTALSALATVALLVSTTSCGEHSWKETQKLHEGMHKGHEEAGHGEAKHEGHAAPAAHTEKAPPHAAPVPAHAAEKKVEAKH